MQGDSLQVADTDSCSLSPVVWPPSAPGSRRRSTDERIAPAPPAWMHPLIPRLPLGVPAPPTRHPRGLRPTAPEPFRR